MTIYAIRKDIPHYQVLDLDLLDITRNLPGGIDLDSVYNFSLLNTAMASWWETPETCYVSTGSRKAQIPDISCWVDATLVLSAKAYRLLKDTLENSGEFLPVQVSGDLYYIFNCFILGKPDEEKCTFNNEEGVRAGLKHLELDSSASNLLLFKVQLENCLTLFCNERFKDMVTSLELEGLIFDRGLIVS
ncbi:MAG TPA: response regulator receiver protein [Cellvibrio sp.]|nr:response regulator receiver protein [Cellvibrio sp.]